MKQKTTHYIYILFLIVFSDEFYAQEFNLEITSKDNKEKTYLNTINFKKNYTDSTKIKAEVQRISEYLKNQGYFINSIDSITKNKKKYLAYFSLNRKIKKIIIKLPNNNFYYKNLTLKNNSFSVPIEKLQTTLEEISKNLDTEGKSFSKVKLKNIELKNNALFADLEIEPSNKRIVDKVIVKGYENFPKSFIKNYFNIKKGTVFNQQKISDISNASNNLQFLKEIKPPEVLFTKDSTFIYLYLKKQQNNSFDGLVNFASEENGELLFNGHIDLKLNNILNKGEQFDLLWNNIGNERQEFKLLAEIPYIFNSKLTPEISFSIYKQDSTFLNTKFNSKIFYNLNLKTKFGITYTFEDSKNLEETINNNIETFKNNFLGIQFSYTIPKNDFFFNNQFHLEINPSIGTRKIENSSSNQFKIETTVSYLWNLNTRNSIYIRNKTAYLNSDTLINNELFRVGGANSIRGFNEQSFFTNNYTFFNVEYRFLTSEKSYFYSITDIGNIKTLDRIEKVIGIGLGYLFTTKTSQISLSTAFGKNSSQNFDLKNSRLIINWKSFF